MFKYIFEDVLFRTIEKNLSLSLNEKEYNCLFSVDDVVKTIENTGYTTTYFGMVYVERLNPSNGENQNITIDFKVIVDENNPSNIKCLVEIKYEYEN